MINQKRLEVQKEAIEALKKNQYNGFAQLPTGTGKALVLIEVLKKLKPKSCWYLCDSEDNRDKTFIDELKKWGAEEWIDKIEFMCYQTAYKLKNFNVDLLLADEADFGLTPSYSKVYLNNKFKHRVLVSGTLSPDKYKLLSKLEIPIVYSIEIDQVEKDKVLNKANYYIVNYLLNRRENFEYLKFNRTFARLLNGTRNKKTLEFLQIRRKHFLSNLETSVNVCRKLMNHLYKNDKHKMLIFCGLSEQADRVCKYSYHSKTTDEAFNLFDKGDLRVLSVVAKADRGLNINGVNVIIFESPTKSSTKFFQRTGRGRRLHVHEELDVYFLIPYYKDLRGQVKPTVVNNWVYTAAAKLQDFNPKTFKF